LGDQTTALHRVTELVATSLGSGCVLEIDDRPAVYRMVAHPDPATAASMEEVTQRWPPDPNAPHGSHAVMRSGEAVWMAAIPDDALVQVARTPEHLELLRKIGTTSYVCVPLRARQRVIGALSLISTEGELAYSESDVSFAQQIADRVALAIDNGRLFREAQAAKAAAEQLYEAEQRARAEAEALFRIAEAVSEAQLDLEKVVQRVTDEATALVGARFGAFFYNVEDANGEAYMLYTLSGAPREAFEKFGLPRKTPIFGPTFDGDAVVRLDDVRKDPRYGTMAPHHGMPAGHLPVTSYLAVPVVSRTGTVTGGLFFGHPEPAQFTEQHERMATALATHAALAIDNAQLFRTTRDAEERQTRLVQELERAVRFSEMFVGILGHDLRNPLSGITTAASLVLSRTDSAQVTKPIGRILSSAVRMSRMIDQILDFTRARLGRGIPLQRTQVDVAEVCRLAMDELKSGIQEHRDMRLEVRGDSVGWWDQDRLAQLLSNLVGNALQHGRPGTPVMVFIDGSQPDQVALAVQNEGCIPPDVFPLAFEPPRGEGPTKREGSSGLGLGLYISKQIAMAHGGSIGVESKSTDDRTRFTVELPRTPPADSEQVFDSSVGPMK
jgi:signal transduction histidine kinase